MRHAAEGGRHLAHGLRRCAVNASHQRGGQHVHHVVIAHQQKVFAVANGRVQFARCDPHPQVAAFIHPRPIAQRLLAKAEPRRVTMRDKLARNRVICIQHGPIFRALKIQNVFLGGGVGFHRAVPVQMVWRNVGDASHMRAARHQLKLKRGQLHHHKIGGAHFGRHANERVANVATHPHFAPFAAKAVIEHLAHQRGGGGFARAARDARDWRGAHIKKDLRIVAQQNVAPFGLQHNGQVNWHAAAQAQRVTAIQQGDGMSAERKRDLPRDVAQAGHIRLRVRIAQGHARALRHKPARQSCALPRRAQDDYIFVKPHFN